MTAADLLALRRGTDGDGYDVSDVLMAYDRPNMPAGMSGSDPIRMCSYCHRGEFNDHAPNCQNVRLSAALTAGAQAINGAKLWKRRWKALAAELKEMRQGACGNGKFERVDGYDKVAAVMGELERGEG